MFDRLRRLVQTLAIRYLDPLFDDRHPGPLLIALIRLAAPLVRQLQPNDRWSLPAFIPEWARLLDQPAPPLRGKSKTIFVLAYYRGQFTPELVAAMLLAWRGHRVVVGYLPKLRSPIKAPLEDSPGVSEYLRLTLAPVEKLTKGRVRCVDMTAYYGRASVRDEAFVASQVRCDVIMKVRKEYLDENGAEEREAFAVYDKLTRDAQSGAWSYFETDGKHIDLCLIANGASFEGAQFMHVARQCGIAVNSFEKFAFARARTITHGAPFFTFDDLDIMLADGDRIGLADPAKRQALAARAWELLAQRRDNTGSAWGWQYQKNTRSLKEGQLCAELGIERDRFVLVCPNVPFDAGYDGWLKVFPSMRDWLAGTVRHLLDHSDLKVVVRAHPAECRPTFDREKVVKVMAEAGIASDRLVIIPGDAVFNTYELMPLCAFASVFASTTGVEIAMHGKAVLAGASVYYERCGLSVPATDRADYFRQLDRLIAGERFDCEAKAEQAAIIYGLFHYFLQWPYPYDKPSQVVAEPPRTLPAHPNVARYVRTLDAMAMSVEEFRAALPELVDPTDDHWS